MLSPFRIVVALLIVVAVATVLISPDPTDDVTGVLHQHVKLQKLAAILMISMDLVIAQLAAFALKDAITSSASHDIFSLLCVRLC
jgi:hypothetical protein